MLGVSYKPNVGDVRESPALKIIELLRELGAEVVYHDPYVRAAGELGLRSAPLEEALDGADLVLIVTAHPGIDYDAIAAARALRARPARRHRGRRRPGRAAVSLRADPRGTAGLHVGEGCRSARTSFIGAHVTIHDGTVVGAGCVIEDGAVLGKRPRLARHSTAPRASSAGSCSGRGVTVCAGAIVFAGTRVIEADAILGDQSFVRERAASAPAA